MTWFKSTGFFRAERRRVVHAISGPPAREKPRAMWAGRMHDPSEATLTSVINVLRRPCAGPAVWKGPDLARPGRGGITPRDVIATQNSAGLCGSRSHG
jgi:hypothetical protein